MSHRIPDAVGRLLHQIGEGPLAPLALPVRWAWVFYRELQRDQAFVRAAGMAYATLVALVPMLVLTYGVLGAVGAADADLEGIVDALMQQVVGQIPEVRDILLPGLRQVNLATLGVVSVCGLLFVAARLYMMVEQAYCDVFSVPVRRGLVFRLLNFYFTMTAIPVVVVLLARGTFALTGEGWWAREGIALGLQYAMLVAALKLFPATWVRWGPALTGAAVSFVLLELGRRGFGLYVRLFASEDPLQVVYGSLGLVPLFLLWLYLIWVFVLLGAEVANVAQNYTTLIQAELEVLEASRPRFPSIDAALQVAGRVADAFRSGEGPLHQVRLVERTGLDGRLVAQTLDVLLGAGILVRTDDGWLPARPPEDIALSEVAEKWRAATVHRIPGDPVHHRIDAALALPGTLADGPWTSEPRGQAPGLDASPAREAG